MGVRFYHISALNGTEWKEVPLLPAKRLLDLCLVGTKALRTNLQPCLNALQGFPGASLNR